MCFYVSGNDEIKYSSVVKKSTTVTTSTEISTSETYSYETCLGLHVDTFVSFMEQETLSTIVKETLTAEGAGLWIVNRSRKCFSSISEEIHMFCSTLNHGSVNISAFASIDVDITVAGQENVIIEG